MLPCSRRPERAVAGGHRLGVAIMLAVYTVGAVGGAHINPAITLAFAVWGRFPWRSVLPYVLAQLIGAFSAAATLFVLFDPYLEAREQERQVVSGAAGSEITAMCYGEYFPSPGPLSNAEGAVLGRCPRASERPGLRADGLLRRAVGHARSCPGGLRRHRRPQHRRGPRGLAPVFIGLTVSA